MDAEPPLVTFTGIREFSHPYLRDLTNKPPISPQSPETQQLLGRPRACMASGDQILI